MLEGGERIVSPGIWYGQVGGVQYQSTIEQAAVLEGPAWTLSEPLPLAPALAAKKARTVLAKLTRGHRLWQVSEISIQRLEGAEPERWFFVVRLDWEGGNPGVLQVPVTFHGVVGKAERVSQK